MRNRLWGTALHSGTHTYWRIIGVENNIADVYADYPDLFLPEGVVPTQDHVDWQLKPDRLQADGKTGEVYYVPSQGWQVGTYDFQAELYDTENEGLIQATQQEHISVTPEAVTQAVSWKVLGILIGVTFIVTLAIVGLILYRRRDMLRGY